MTRANELVPVVKNIWGQAPIARTSYFRKSFALRAPLQRALLRIFVDTGYELYLNGRFVAEVDEWNNTRDYDVTPWLVAGENAVAVKGLNHGGHRGFALELLLSFADGTVESVVTDESWKASLVERWGWRSAGYDDNAWECARVLDLSQSGAAQWKDRPGADASKIMPCITNSLFFQQESPKCAASPFFNRRRAPVLAPAPVLEIVGEEYRQSQNEYPPEVLFATRVVECAPGSGRLENSEGLLSGSKDALRVTVVPGSGEIPVVVAEFGEEVVGYPRLRIASSGAVSLRLIFAEVLHECHYPPTADMLLRKMVVEEVRLGAGDHEWESRRRQGFRFVRIEFLDATAPVSVSGLSVKTSIYHTAYAGYFACSDTELNRLWRAGRKTLHLCMQEYYLDGIKRDRFLWVADARLEVLINYYAFGDRELFRYSWERLAAAQYQDGGIPSVLGEGAPILWDYVAWWIIACEDYYLYTGDLDWCRSLQPSIVRAMDWLIAKAGEDGLIDVPVNRTEGWMCVLNNKSGKELMLNQLFYRSLCGVSRLLRELGKPELAATYLKLSEKTRAAFDALPGSPGMDAFAPPGDYFASASVECVEILENHFRHGCVAEALAFLKENWLPMLTAGTDTFWEAPVKQPPLRVDEVGSNFRSISHCHGWTGGPTYALSAGVLGIRPTASGFATVEVRPQLGSLAFAKGVVPTPQGLIAVSFTQDGGALSGVMVFPESCRATLVLPSAQAASIRFARDDQEAAADSWQRRTDEKGDVLFELSVAGKWKFTTCPA